MFVKDEMSTHPITITPESSILSAERVMKENGVRHLPVVNSSMRLLGLLTRTALEQVLPSKLTTLSVYELHYQLDKITVREAMIRDVVTATENEPIEQAARIMLEKKIGSLPVVRDDRLVGIITAVDLMRTMMELLGARQPGIRLTLKIPGTEGEFAKITTAIASQHGDISAMGTLPAGEPLKWMVVLKVRFVEKDCLISTLSGLPEVEIVDLRQD